MNYFHIAVTGRNNSMWGCSQLQRAQSTNSRAEIKFTDQRVCYLFLLHSVTVTNTVTQTIQRRKGLISAYMVEQTPGRNSSRNSKQKPLRNNACWPPWAHTQATFLHIPRPNAKRMVMPKEGWTLLCQLLVNIPSIDMSLDQTALAVLELRLSSQITLGCVELAVKANEKSGPRS